MSDLFRKLRDNNSQDSSSSQYSFGGESHPFRDRPGSSTTSRSTMAQPRGRPNQAKRTPDKDRESAYAPPVAREQGVVYEWEPPTFYEILKDLGLRVAEVAIAAAAQAAGREVAYFFDKRRFYTEEQRRRKDY